MPIRSTARPILQQLFRSSSGRTAILYFRYGSGVCGGTRSCDFSGPIKALPDFDQVEVFLRGFTLETQQSATPVDRISAEVQKHRYDPALGELEVSVKAQISGSGQGHSYGLTFVVVLTDSPGAKFTPLGNGCSDVDTCKISLSPSNPVPAGMDYIGIGTRRWDLGFNRGGPFPLNTLAGHVDPLKVTPPDVSLDWVAMLHDTQLGRSMFMEWDAAVIAFDASEMAQSTSSLFPKHAFTSTSLGARYGFDGGGSALVPITGVLDAFDGLRLWYPDPAVEHDVWRVEASAGTPTITSPSSARVDLGVHLGPNFGDRTSGAPYAFEVSRAFGYLL